ncbi:alpha/beta hydrolase [Salicibibacter halophilus]|uniref:Alpha/beta hydrolase n=1 Tax=Salicibibacter halophilus TaxID=2502791 RepID=A0A514LE39_9BACI|nr:alpha/beta hydrolase [Salicibibacter halophilus]QDI90118.1 alpha/beta hydrolase [Salicibibacter halophilus]
MSYVDHYPVQPEEVNVQHYPASNSDAPRRLFVLIHGFMSSAYSYQAMIPELRLYGEVVTFDLPGFGKSKKTLRYHYSYAQYAKTVDSIIKPYVTEQTEVVPVGHSMGGQIALRLPKTMSRPPKKIVLLASSGGIARLPSWLRTATYLPFFSFWLRRYIRKHDVRNILDEVIYDSSMITNEHVYAYEKPLREKAMYKALAKFIRHRDSDLTRKELAAIDVPVLLLWGEADSIVPLQVGEKLVSALPCARLATYPEIGHLLSEEMPAETAKAIQSFAEE